MAQLNRPFGRRYDYHGHTFTGPAHRSVPLSPLILGAAVLLALLIVVLGYQMMHLGRIYRGVSVYGVDLGGARTEEAVARLRQAVDARSAQPLTLTYEGRDWIVSAHDLGLRFDPAPVVREAYGIGRDGSIFERSIERFRVAIRGERLDNLGFAFDRSVAEAHVASLAGQIERPPVDAEASISRDGKVTLTPSQIGRRIDRNEALNRIGAVILRPGESRIDLPVRELPPKVRDEQVRDAYNRAQAMLSAPVMLSAGETIFTLTPKDIASMIAIRMEGEGDHQRAIVIVDDTKLKHVVEPFGPKVAQEPSDARFERLPDGQIKVIRESAVGRTLDAAAAIEFVKQRLDSPERTIALPVVEAQPAVRSQDAAMFAGAQLIDENKSDYSGGSADRRHNIQRATSRLHGIVLQPGQTFSFIESLGPQTLQNGYRMGFAISRGPNGLQTIPAEGGGICQVATTLFQSVFFAGYQVDERHSHSYWIPRYGTATRGMKGLDATVDDANLDFKFTNNTEHPLLIQGRTDGKNLIFQLYGTKPTWQVKVDGPRISNAVPADHTPREELSPLLPAGQRVAVESPQDGFNAEIVRTVTQGADVRTLRIRSNYQPSRNVTLVGQG